MKNIQENLEIFSFEYFDINKEKCSKVIEIQIEMRLLPIIFVPLSNSFGKKAEQRRTRKHLKEINTNELTKSTQNFARKVLKFANRKKP